MSEQHYGDISGRAGDAGDQGEQLREEEEQQLIREQAAGKFPDSENTVPNPGQIMAEGDGLIAADSDDDNASNDPFGDAGDGVS